MVGMPELGRFKAEFFKALAHPLRIAILDSLRDGERTVNELCVALRVEQSSLSQQLAVLRTRDIVSGRKEGLNVFYSVNDPTVFKLLDVAPDGPARKLGGTHEFFRDEPRVYPRQDSGRNSDLQTVTRSCPYFVNRDGDVAYRCSRPSLSPQLRAFL